MGAMKSTKKSTKCGLNEEYSNEGRTVGIQVGIQSHNNRKALDKPCFVLFFLKRYKKPTLKYMESRWTEPIFIYRALITFLPN